MKIVVNKECIISDKSHFKHQYIDETVVNVSAIDDKDGFVQFVLAYDSQQSCCEYCKAITNIPDTSTRVFVTEIEVTEGSDAYEGHEDFTYGLEAGGCVSFVIHTDDENIKYEGFVANSHNGYYSHYVVWTNGDLVYETAI